jgi:hypothetical protein
MAAQIAAIRQSNLSNTIYQTPVSSLPAPIHAPQYVAQVQRVYGSPLMVESMYRAQPHRVSQSSSCCQHPITPSNYQAKASTPGTGILNQQRSQLMQPNPLYSHQQPTKPPEQSTPPSTSVLTQPQGTSQKPQKQGLASIHLSSAGSASSANATPRPIPATTPRIIRQDDDGVQWMVFEYSQDRVKTEFTIRCDVESVNTRELSQDFMSANCVYPRANCNKDQYKGNRLAYESECNALGCALALLNPSLREKRGLIQRAVDSWRNTNKDLRLRSRRLRRMDRTYKKK